MAALKKFFPLSYTFGQADLKSLIIGIVIYVLAGMILGALVGITAIIPVVGVILISILCPLIGLYCLAGIIIELLLYFGVLKD